VSGDYSHFFNEAMAQHYMDWADREWDDYEPDEEEEDEEQ
jgi:hypothetical protein